MPDICRIVFACRDLERTRAFYVALGFHLKKGVSGPVPCYAATCGAFHLEFWPAPKDATKRAYHPTRLDYRVKNVREVADRLRAAFPKIEIHEFDRETHCIDATDPDGRYVILEEDPPSHMPVEG